MTNNKHKWVISKEKVLTFELFLKVEMFYGISGHKIFLLKIGEVGTPISKFQKVSGWIEELLGDAFEQMNFNPERFKYSSTCYPDLLEAISKHNSEEPLTIPFVLEFSNTKKTPVIEKVKSSIQKKGFTIDDR
ncbi:hypothetical protein F7734_36070 [Scytonema sp. UIC 10036]|uniref:hypothetical protein n=1 Tax=Scytonema sp. UIC 10036 TaxID=2304196 RepID=UPI0012DA3AED|nr:hypothetical protein [Scytonema sp. UIC 10036]MUG97454.1 hypothetical protein [Scytonema sp. UIC 10036]